MCKHAFFTKPASSPKEEDGGVAMVTRTILCKSNMVILLFSGYGGIGLCTNESAWPSNYSASQINSHQPQSAYDAAIAHSATQETINFSSRLPQNPCKCDIYFGCHSIQNKFEESNLIIFIFCIY